MSVWDLNLSGMCSSVKIGNPMQACLWPAAAAVASRYFSNFAKVGPVCEHHILTCTCINGHIN